MDTFKRVTNYALKSLDIADLMFDLSMIEKRGAIEFTGADQMPIDIIAAAGKNGKTPQEIYKTLGFMFPDQSNNEDPLFIDAKLPDGWHKEINPDDPSGRTINVFDENKIKRIVVWYKAASYDRKAIAHYIEVDK